ncbi:MAG: MCE family protein [Candidatus Eisenbacteria bacterium]|nr:MCE family protein [Candidatus Eisenbacteria bacterium]
MTSKGLEWKVGLVVLAATVLFVVGVIYLGQMEIGRPGPRVRVAFPEVGGLNVGDPVMVSGLRRGSVSSIELGTREVLVTLKLRPDVVLHTDASFRVENMGIMGEKFIAVLPGTSSDTLDTRNLVRGGYSPGITEAMAELGIVLDDVGKIVARVEGLLQEQEIVGPMREAVRYLRDVSADLQGMLAENRTDVRSSIQNFRSLSENLDETLRENRGKIDTAVTRAAAASARFDETMERLDRTILSLEEVVQRMENGQGTLGQLSQDDKLYKEMMDASRNLNDLLRDVRENPKRYLKITIF